MVFPRAGTPSELMAAFGRVRAAFQISPVLEGIVG
jgi:hypothetical protein